MNTYIGNISKRINKYYSMKSCLGTSSIKPEDTEYSA